MFMKNSTIWILAIVITIGAAYYQRKTGPTYPKKVKIELNGVLQEFKLIRTSNNDKDARIEITIPDTLISGSINYRLFPIKDTWKTVELVRNNENLIAFLPKQPAAGKLEYYVSLVNSNNPEEITSTEHIIIRFKGNVPAWALIPHILFMFVAMLLSTLTGFMAVIKNEKQQLYGKLTLLFLFVGGMIFGPIIQQYAFGQAWTGVPFGWDLTDNKTLIALIFWIIAVIANRKKANYKLTILASIVLFLIYIIPHSLFGSEFDYSQGKVVTGLITGIFW
jgi:hypothetical protein